MSKDLILCDVDGTLADNSHRSPYDESCVIKDAPLPTCEVIKTLAHRYDIAFLSGRTLACYESTSDWLKQHVMHQHDDHPLALFMRSIGDNRADEIVKKELFDKHIRDTSRVLGVFDDRLKVCRMWYDMGLFVFNCNQGLKEF